MQAGLRPAFCDNEPQIIVAGKQIQINGLYRHGFMISPVIVLQSLRELKQMGLPLPSLPFYDAQIPTEIKNKLVIKQQ